MSDETTASASAIHSYQLVPMPPGGTGNWVAHLLARTTDRRVDQVGTLILTEKDGEKCQAISDEVCLVLDRLFKANQQ